MIVDEKTYIKGELYVFDMIDKNSKDGQKQEKSTNKTIEKFSKVKHLKNLNGLELEKRFGDVYFTSEDRNCDYHMIRMLKPDLSKAKRKHFFVKTYKGKMTRENLNHYTMSISERI